MEINFTPFPTLTTDRLILRQLEAADAGAIFAHRSDDIVNTYLEDFRYASLEESHAFINRIHNETGEGKTILWALTRKGNNQFMGTVCFWNISGEECKAETGYTLVSEFHNMGYMNEALVKIIDFGFTTLKLKVIEAYTHEHNNASIQLLLKNKFIQGMPKKPVGKDRIFFSLRLE